MGGVDRVTGEGTEVCELRMHLPNDMVFTVPGAALNTAELDFQRRAQQDRDCSRPR
jgi:hypothetical protein